MAINAIVPFEQSQNAITAPNIPTTSAIESMYQLARLASKSGLSKAKSEQDAFFIIMYGYELGISPMTALRTIYSVNGTPTCSGEAMLALIRKSGKVKVTLPDIEKVKLEGKAAVTMERKDTGEKYTATFSLKEADNARLMGNPTWKNYPSNMLVWRCVSNAAKFLCSDIIGGLYTLDEIAPQTPLDENGAPTGDIVQGEVVTEDKPAWHTREKIDLLFGTMLQNGLGEHETLRLAGVPDKYSDKWGKFESGKAAGLAIMAALEAELEVDPIEPDMPPVDPEPDTPPGWEDIKKVFPNDVVPPAPDEPERVKFTQLIVSTFQKDGIDEYKLTFHTEPDTDGKVIKASTFHYGKYITMGLLTEKQLMAKETIALVGVTGQIEQTKDKKYWNVVDGTVKQDLAF